MKKVFLYFFGIFIVLIGLLIVIPMLVDLNHFKPQIQKEISKNIHADVDFSSIRLKLIPHIGFHIADFSVKNADAKFKGTSLFSVKSVDLKVDFFALFSKKVLATLVMDAPDVSVVKTSSANNIEALFPKQNVQLQPSQTPSKTAEMSSKKSGSLADSMLKDMEIKSLEFHDANISFWDQSVLSSKPFLLKEIQLVVSNIGIDRDVKLHFETNVNVSKDQLNVSGPISADFVTNTKLQGTQWKNTLFQGKIDLDDLRIYYAEAFKKSGSVPLNFSLSGNAQPDQINIKNFVLNFQKVQSKLKGSVTNFKTLDTNLLFTLSTKNLAALEDVLPGYEKFIQSGSLDVTSEIAGPLTQTNRLKTDTTVKAVLAKESDFNLNFQESSLEPLVGSFKMTSNQLKLGELMKPLQGDEDSKATAPVQPQPVSTKTAEKGVKPQSEFVLPADQKKQLMGTRFSMDISVDRLFYEKYDVRNLQFKATLRDLLLRVNWFRMHAFNGDLDTKATAYLDKMPVAYQGSLELSHVETAEVAKVLENQWADTISGTANIRANYNGAGTTKDVAVRNLNADVKYSFLNGKLKMKNVLSFAKGELTNIVKKLPIPKASDLANEQLPKIKLAKDQEYYDLDGVSGNVKIEKGVLISQERYQTGEGRFNANVRADLLTTDLSGDVNYVSTEPVAAQIEKVDENFGLLFNKRRLLELDLELSGKVTEPKVSVKKDNLVANLKRNGKEKVKQEATKEVERQVKKNKTVNKFLKKHGVDPKKLDLKDLKF